MQQPSASSGRTAHVCSGVVFLHCLLHCVHHVPLHAKSAHGLLGLCSSSFCSFVRVGSWKRGYDESSIPTEIPYVECRDSSTPCQSDCF